MLQRRKATAPVSWTSWTFLLQMLKRQKVGIKTTLRASAHKDDDVPVGHDAHHQVAEYGAHEQRELGDVDLPGRVAHQVPLKRKTEKTPILIQSFIKESKRKKDTFQCVSVSKISRKPLDEIKWNVIIGRTFWANPIQDGLNSQLTTENTKMTTFQSVWQTLSWN